MSLEQTLANAIAAQDALTQAVAGKMAQLDTRINSFVDGWGVDGYTTIEVGVGKQFLSIQDAWNSVLGKAFKADVLIKVSDGQYDVNSLYFAAQPQGIRIRIQGNKLNPQNCVIRFVADQDKFSHGVIVGINQRVVMEGFTYLGVQSETHWTLRGIFVNPGASFYADPDTLRFEECGVECYGGDFKAWGAVFNGVRGNAVCCAQGGTVEVTEALINCASKTQSFSHPSGSQFRPAALYAYDNGVIYAGLMQASDARFGALAERGGVVASDRCLISRAEYGQMAAYGGTVWSHWDGTTRSRHVDCSVGIEARYNSTVIANGASVTTANGTNVGSAFRATDLSLIEVGGGVFTNQFAGAYVESLSLIKAANTSAPSTATTKYSAATGTAHNFGSYIQWS